MLDQATEQIVVFESGSKAFGIDLDRVEGIIEKHKVIPVPNIPAVAEGIVLYRNGILSVIDLLRLLGIGGEGGGGLLIVVRGVSEDFGVSSGHIFGIRPADQLDIRTIPTEKRENPYIRGIGDFNGREFSLLDFQNIGGTDA